MWIDSLRRLKTGDFLGGGERPAGICRRGMDSYEKGVAGSWGNDENDPRHPKDMV